MNFLSKVFKRRPSRFVLEAESQLTVKDPTEEHIRAVVLGLRRGETSFASLTDQAGNYIQVAGSRPWCVVERRCLTPLQHERAFQETPKPKYKDGAKLSTGAGELSLQHDEWFLLKDAAELFLAFHRGSEMPVHVKWRSMNEMLGLG